ncbi:hypothetical protein D3C77_712210 [compost metagenome]
MFTLNNAQHSRATLSMKPLPNDSGTVKAAAANSALTTTRLRLPSTLAPFFTRRSHTRPATMVPRAPKT